MGAQLWPEGESEGFSKTLITLKSRTEESPVDFIDYEEYLTRPAVLRSEVKLTIYT